MFGICNLSLIPARAEDSDKSEMVTSLLFGEHFTILEHKERWTKIKLAFDNYECWIGNKQFIPITEEEFNQLQQQKSVMVADIAQVVTHITDKQSIPVVMGSMLPFYHKHQFKIANDPYKYEGPIQITTSKNIRYAIIETAYLYLNSPYLWGGKSPFGIDCSGFTQMVFKINGVALLRDAHQQSTMGNALSFLEEALPGDLAFFDNEAGHIIHVGIVLKGNKIIHSSGKVRIDNIDHQGIYNQEIKQYTHTLRIIKNMLND